MNGFEVLGFSIWIFWHFWQFLVCAAAALAVSRFEFGFPKGQGLRAGWGENRKIPENASSAMLRSRGGQPPRFALGSCLKLLASG